MADTWIACTNIKYGKGDEIRHIQEGMPVSGLPDEVMKELAESGSIIREKELFFLKQNLPGVSNSFSLADIPDTPAGRKVTKALQELREEEARAALDEYKQPAEDSEDADSKKVDDPNVPPRKASETKTADTGGSTAPKTEEKK
jgi:hypothetical protein